MAVSAVFAPLTLRQYSPLLMAMRNEPSAAQAFISATRHASQITLALALAFLALTLAGCGSDQIEANNKLLQQQQEQIEKQQQEIEAIKSNQNQTYAPGVAASPSAHGGCDKQVEQSATEHGGDRFAAGDFSKALGYYQDALTACPNDDRANVNVARTYEALHNGAQAIKYYRKAAESSGPTVSDASEEAQAALLRLQASQLP